MKKVTKFWWIKIFGSKKAFFWPFLANFSKVHTKKSNFLKDSHLISFISENYIVIAFQWHQNDPSILFYSKVMDFCDTMSLKPNRYFEVCHNCTYPFFQMQWMLYILNLREFFTNCRLSVNSADYCVNSLQADLFRVPPAESLKTISKCYLLMLTPTHHLTIIAKMINY